MSEPDYSEMSESEYLNEWKELDTFTSSAEFEKKEEIRLHLHIIKQIVK
jgi:hypothetical protein